MASPSCYGTEEQKRRWLTGICAGEPIGGFQLVQEMLADMAVETDATRLLVWRVADLIDRHLPFETEASMAKYYASGLVST